LHNIKWSNGKKKKGWKQFSLKKKKNNSIQESVRNEENGYPDPDLKKTMINVIKEPSDTHIKPSKRKKSLRNSWKRY
jgi:hypothetical protein